MNTNIVVTAAQALAGNIRAGVVVKRLANCIKWHQDMIESCRGEMRRLQEVRQFDPDLGRQVRRSQQTIKDLSETIFQIKKETGVIPA